MRAGNDPVNKNHVNLQVLESTIIIDYTGYDV